MNPTGADKTKGEKRYGDLGIFKADSNGEYEASWTATQLNLYGQFTAIGRMWDCHKASSDDYDEGHTKHPRAASFAVLGRTGVVDEVPQWDLAPHPCYGWDASMPHGGKNQAFCDIWKAINESHPEINIV
jgi:hypothetical protein